MKKDITDIKDIERMINSFYEKVKVDEVIGHFFTQVVKVNWEKHMPVMYRFWDNALFYTGVYEGKPMEMHLHLHQLSPLLAVHFQRWNELFAQTVDDLFEGQKANMAKERAQSISTIMQIEILKKA